MIWYILCVQTHVINTETNSALVRTNIIPIQIMILTFSYKIYLTKHYCRVQICQILKKMQKISLCSTRNTQAAFDSSPKMQDERWQFCKIFGQLIMHYGYNKFAAMLQDTGSGFVFIYIEVIGFVWIKLMKYRPILIFVLTYLRSYNRGNKIVRDFMSVREVPVFRYREKIM